MKFNKEIYLFIQNEEQDNFSMLNDFISFLKFRKIKGPYKFAYVGEDDLLIKELTLLENLVMDFSPNSLTDSKEFQFQQFLKEQDNQELEELFLKIGHGHELALNANAQMKKICSLIKSLIFDGDFIFLESPENNLDEENLNLFIKALQKNVQHNGKVVFIFSKRTSFWKNHCEQLVSRNLDFSFRVTAIKEECLFIEEKTKFYENKVNVEEKSHNLRFNIPKQKKKKNSAA